MAEASGVLIYAEQRDGTLAPIVAELLGIGRSLAQALGEGLAAVMVGRGISDATKQELVALGAERIYVADDPLCAHYQNEPYVAALEAAARVANPNVFLLGQTFQGRDLAPRLAFRLRTGLVTDCVELSIDTATKRLVMVKPVYGGNARAMLVNTKALPQMATIRPKAFAAAPPDPSRRGELIALAVGGEASAVKARFVERVKAVITGVKLEDARVVVAGGRGMGSKENFASLQELAKVLGGAVGASRGAVDAGYATTEQQIGLSGKVVTPDLYIAVGISGAAQHLAGCSGAKTIVALNRDADAAIFKVAQFGVVGTWQQALPAFTEKCRELLKQ